MSKYLIWLIVFIAVTFVGAFYFTTELKGLALPFMLWVPVALFTAALGGVQWKVYSDAKHHGKADSLYSKYLGMPIAEFEALSDATKAELQAAVERVRAEAQKLRA